MVVVVAVVSSLLSATEESIFFCVREVMDDDVRNCRNVIYDVMIEIVYVDWDFLTFLFVSY